MQAYDALIDRIYAAALEPGQWPAAIEGLSEYLAAPMVRLFTPFLPVQAGGLTFATGFTVDTDALYRAGRYDRDDLWTQRMVERGHATAGSVCLGSELATDEELRQTRFWRDLLVPFGTTQLCCGIVFDTGDPGLPTTACSAYRGEDHPRFGAEEKERMRVLVRHLSRALGVTFRLRDSEMKLAAAHSALDGLAHGIVLLDRQARILFANRAATRLVRARRGIDFTGAADGLGERLTAGNAESAERIRRALQSAVAPGQAEPTHFVDSVPIADAEGKPSFLLQAAPLGANRQAHGFPGDAVAIAFLLDVGRAPRIDAGVLSQLYQFTAAESRVAQALVDGAGAATVAAELGVAESTVRSHLKAMFGKTGVASQGDLIRVLMSVASARDQ